LIRAYQECCTNIIRAYEGFVAKYMGDGILVYFGYPKSLERNAERAVRSGLAIVEAIAELNAELERTKGIEIAVRIGIATGLVVVGEIVGEGLAQERTVIGEAPNIAARLQSLASRNGIVIGALTKEIIGDAFVYQELGAHELKGVTGLVKVWAVLRLAEEAEEDGEGRGGRGRGPAALGRPRRGDLARSAERVVAFYNQRGTAEQHIREGKNAVKWTRLSCRTFRNNAVRLQLHALAYNLANFMRTLALPEEVEHWSLTTLREKLVKIGARIVRHGRYVVFQLAEVAVPRTLFAEILRRIDRLRPRPPPSPA
jgi:hypothetical protein